MSRPDVAWFCAECGYKIRDPHTCPPEAREVVHTLVDGLPRNVCPDAVRQEVEEVRRMLREHRPDALQVSATTLSWLLAALSYLDVAEDALKAHKAILEGK